MHGLALLHRGPENVTLFHVTVVSTNIDQFLEYLPNSRPYTELIYNTTFFLIYPPQLRIAAALP